VYTGESLVCTGESLVYTGESLVYNGESLVFTGESLRDINAFAENPAKIQPIYTD
jgi:hypothetical protein